MSMANVLIRFLGVACILGVNGGAAGASSREKPVLGAGEVTAKDVYIRSGPSTNHYVICKLQAGDRVILVGEEGEWHEILPPPGTFSLISGEFVDTVDNRVGVVNADNVRVRAGSLLNETKYTVQINLSRGDEVTILGRNPDGFLRIEPPPGATLWVNRGMVKPAPNALARPTSPSEGTSPIALDGSTLDAAGEGQVPAPPSRAAEGAAVSATDARDTKVTTGPTIASPTNPNSGASSATVKSPKPPANSAVRTGPSSPWSEADAASSSPLAGLPPTPQRAALQNIDANMKAEFTKPAAERQFQPLIEQYRTIAQQQEDEFGQVYAQKRLEQLSNMQEIVDAVQRVSGLDEGAEAKRREFLAGRANLPYVSLSAAPSGPDAQGELRVSALYPPGSLPRRYRLVDPTTPHGQTIGYVELPSDSTMAIESFLGRYVGVRASERKLQIGGVDPVPIYVARELMLLQPAAPTAGSSGRE